MADSSNIPIEQFRAYLARKGMRLTEERSIVAKLALQYSPPIDVENLVDEARALPVSISRATVYRTVAQLDDAGLIFRRPR